MPLRTSPHGRSLSPTSVPLGRAGAWARKIDEVELHAETKEKELKAAQEQVRKLAAEASAISDDVSRLRRDQVAPPKVPGRSSGRLGRSGNPSAVLLGDDGGWSRKIDVVTHQSKLKEKELKAARENVRKLTSEAKAISEDVDRLKRNKMVETASLGENKSEVVAHPVDEVPAAPVVIAREVRAESQAVDVEQGVVEVISESRENSKSDDEFFDAMDVSDAVPERVQKVLQQSLQPSPKPAPLAAEKNRTMSLGRSGMVTPPPGSVGGTDRKRPDASTPTLTDSIATSQSSLQLDWRLRPSDRRESDSSSPTMSSFDSKAHSTLQLDSRRKRPVRRKSDATTPAFTTSGAKSLSTVKIDTQRTPSKRRASDAVTPTFEGALSESQRKPSERRASDAVTPTFKSSGAQSHSTLHVDSRRKKQSDRRESDATTSTFTSSGTKSLARLKLEARRRYSVRRKSEAAAPTFKSSGATSLSTSRVDTRRKPADVKVPSAIANAEVAEQPRKRSSKKESKKPAENTNSSTRGISDFASFASQPNTDAVAGGKKEYVSFASLPRPGTSEELVKVSKMKRRYSLRSVKRLMLRTARKKEDKVEKSPVKTKKSDMGVALPVSEPEKSEPTSQLEERRAKSDAIAPRAASPTSTDSAPQSDSSPLLQVRRKESVDKDPSSVPEVAHRTGNIIPSDKENENPGGKADLSVREIDSPVPVSPQARIEKDVLEAKILKQKKRFQHHIASLKTSHVSELESLKQKRSESESDFQELMDALKTAHKLEADNLRRKNDDSENKFNQSLVLLTGELKSVKEECVALALGSKAAISDLESELESRNGKIDSLRQKLELSQKQGEIKQKLLIESERTLRGDGSSSMEAIQADLLSVKSQLEVRNSKIDTLNHELEECQKEIKAQEVRLVERERSIRSENDKLVAGMKTDLASVVSELNSRNRSNVALCQEIETFKQATALKERDVLEREKSIRTESLAEIASVQSDLNLAKSELQSRDKDFDALRKELVVSKKQIVLKNEQLRVQKQVVKSDRDAWKVKCHEDKKISQERIEAMKTAHKLEADTLRKQRDDFEQKFNEASTVLTNERNSAEEKSRALDLDSKAKISGIESELQTRNSQIDALQHELEATKKQALSKEQELAERERCIRRESEGSVKALQAELTMVNSQLEIRTCTINSLRQELELFKEQSILKEEEHVQREKSARTEMDAALQAMRADFASVTQQLAQLRSEAREAEASRGADLDISKSNDSVLEVSASDKEVVVERALPIVENGTVTAQCELKMKAEKKYMQLLKKQTWSQQVLEFEEVQNLPAEKTEIGTGVHNDVAKSNAADRAAAAVKSVPFGPFSEEEDEVVSVWASSSEKAAAEVDNPRQEDEDPAIESPMEVLSAPCSEDDDDDDEVVSEWTTASDQSVPVDNTILPGDVLSSPVQKAGAAEATTKITTLPISEEVKSPPRDTSSKVVSADGPVLMQNTSLLSQSVNPTPDGSQDSIAGLGFKKSRAVSIDSLKKSMDIREDQSANVAPEPVVTKEAELAPGVEEYVTSKTAVVEQVVLHESDAVESECVDDATDDSTEETTAPVLEDVKPLATTSSDKAPVEPATDASAKEANVPVAEVESLSPISSDEASVQPAALDSTETRSSPVEHAPADSTKVTTVPAVEEEKSPLPFADKLCVESAGYDSADATTTAVPEAEISLSTSVPAVMEPAADDSTKATIAIIEEVVSLSPSAAGDAAVEPAVVDSTMPEEVVSVSPSAADNSAVEHAADDLKNATSVVVEASSVSPSARATATPGVEEATTVSPKSSDKAPRVGEVQEVDNDAKEDEKQDGEDGSLLVKLTSSWVSNLTNLFGSKEDNKE